MVFLPELKGASLNAYNNALSLAVKKALSEFKVSSQDQLVIRELRPQDLGLPNGVWSFTTTANAETTIIDTNVNKGRIIVINGVFYPISGTQAITQLTVTSGSGVARIWTIQGISYLENETAYFVDPLTIKQNNPITIQAYATAASTDEPLVLLGTVVELKGMVIG